MARIPREKNAAWVYIEAVNAYVEPPQAVQEAFDYAVQTAWPEGQTALAAYLDDPANQLAMETARRASSMERCQMPYFGDANQSIVGMLLPNLSNLRFLGKLMVAQGRRLEAADDFSGAASSYLTAMGLGEHTAQAITLIEGLVGIAVWSLADRALIDMVLRRPLSAKQLGMLEAEFKRRAPRLPSAEVGLRCEGRFGPAMVDELCSRPLHFVGNFTALLNAEDGIFFGSAGPVPEDGWGRLEQRIGKLIFPDRAIKRHMKGYYDRVVERSVIGAYRATQMDFDDERYLAKKIPQWDILSRALLPSLSRATTLGELCKAELALIRAATAIRRHMLAHEGRPPVNLDELTQRLPQDALIDPFSDRTLVYRQGDGTWMIYSIGEDFIDDGGRTGKRRNVPDIVYRFPPDPLEPFDTPEQEE
ncbi:MAG: hypothetical protein IIB60_04620 [Planctomycetes bacterium]|nr:hypothetical protein [Planctomycetota bacterium]